MTNLAGSSPPGVMTASPVGRPEGQAVRRSSWQAERMAGPPARWMAPPTPPPPRREPFAAFTMASTLCRVMSPDIATTAPSRKRCMRCRDGGRGSALIRADELGPREHVRLDARLEALLRRRRRAQGSDVQRVDAMRIAMRPGRRARAAIADRAEIVGA